MPEISSIRDWPRNAQATDVPQIDFLVELGKQCEKVKIKKTAPNGDKFYEATLPTAAGYGSTLFRWENDSNWTYRLPGKEEKIILRTPYEIALVLKSLTNAPTTEEYCLLDDFEAAGELVKLKDRINEIMNDPYYYSKIVVFTLKEIRGNRAQQARNKLIQESQALALKEKEEAAEKKYGRGLAVCGGHIATALRENKNKHGEIDILDYQSQTSTGVYCYLCGGTVCATIILTNLRSIK